MKNPTHRKPRVVHAPAPIRQLHPSRKTDTHPDKAPPANDFFALDVFLVCLLIFVAIAVGLPILAAHLATPPAVHITIHPSFEPPANTQRSAPPTEFFEHETERFVLVPDLKLPRCAKEVRLLCKNPATHRKFIDRDGEQLAEGELTFAWELTGGHGGIHQVGLGSDADIPAL